MRRLLLIAGLMLIGQPAQAATVTRQFELTASSFVNFFNEPAPFSTLEIAFGVTYDDTANGFVGAPDTFTAVTDGQVNAGPFSATPAFGYFQPNGFSTFPRLVFGGALNGTNVLLNGTNDFFFSFDASATGPTGAMLSFTNAANIVPFLATDASVTPVAVAAVPEPSVWFMMIAGLATIGAVLRRHRAAPALA